MHESPQEKHPFGECTQDSWDGAAEVRFLPPGPSQEAWGEDRPRYHHAEGAPGNDGLDQFLSSHPEQDYGQPAVGQQPPGELSKVHESCGDFCGWLWCEQYAPSILFNYLKVLCVLVFYLNMFPSASLSSIFKINHYILRQEGCATIAREPNLQVVLTSLGSIWIVNRTENKIDLPAGELFGFNTGAYAEINAGPGF